MENHQRRDFLTMLLMSACMPAFPEAITPKVEKLQQNGISGSHVAKEADRFGLTSDGHIRFTQDASKAIRWPDDLKWS